MGYYTWYQLNVFELDGKAKVDDELLNKYEFSEGFAVNNIINPQDSMKWYNFNSDMLKLSSLFPLYIFELYGDGEESNDIWITWYWNKRYYDWTLCINYPEVDRAKLFSLDISSEFYNDDENNQMEEHNGN